MLGSGCGVRVLTALGPCKENTMGSRTIDWWQKIVPLDGEKPPCPKHSLNGQDDTQPQPLLPQIYLNRAHRRCQILVGPLRSLSSPSSTFVYSHKVTSRVTKWLAWGYFKAPIPFLGRPSASFFSSASASISGQ